ncbi:MAG TPA: hypothetical protein VGM27_11270, partial [Acidobacteriaceae bacterium]
MAKRQSFGLVLGAALAFGMNTWGEHATTSASAIGSVGGALLTSTDQDLASNVRRAKVSALQRHQAKKMFLAGAKAMERNDPR